MAESTYNFQQTAAQLQQAINYILQLVVEGTASELLSNTAGYLVPADIAGKANAADVYTKQETYSQAQVDALIQAIRQFTIVVASELPAASTSTMYKIYLIPSSNPETQNTKDEYITVEESGSYRWELIGSTAIDLSAYSTTEEMNAAIAAAEHRVDVKIGQLGQEVDATNLHIDGSIDNGTIYNELDPSFTRVCVFYPIADVDAEYTIKVSDIALASGNGITIAIRSAETPYTASLVQAIRSNFTSETERTFTIAEENKANAKFIAVNSVGANASASFKVELKRNNSIQEQIDSIEDSLDSIEDSLDSIEDSIQELEEKDVELEGKFVAIDGIIDKGTIYDTPGEHSRVAVYYPISDVDAEYELETTDIVLADNSDYLQYALRSAETPYTASLLVSLTANSRDPKHITFTIPDEYKETAKYIAINQHTANSAASFKVSLKTSACLDARVADLEEKIDDEPGVLHDIIPYNDEIFVGGRLLRIYNPYKDGGSHQYAGQMHCHSWTDRVYNGVRYKVPIGYTVEQVAAMTEAERNALVESVNQQFVAAHKTVGFSFMTITNYDRFADYTPKPAVMPSEFLWLGNGFEANLGGWDSTGQSEDKGAHMCVINTDWGKMFDGYTTQEVVDYAEDRNCVVTYAHPFLNMIYSSPEFAKQVKKRLRFIEVFNGLGYYHAPGEGDVPYIKPGIEIDEDFDALLTQGNFVFGIAVSDERVLNTNSTSPLKWGCVKVFANSLNHKAIWGALLSGNFYACENVNNSLLGVELDGNTYKVNVGVAGVTIEFLKEDNTVISTVVTTSENTIASYIIQGTEKFVRARIYTLVDGERKNQMWTQPILIAPNIL